MKRYGVKAGAGVLVGALALGVVSAARSSFAQDGKSTMDGVYTDAQATRGAELSTKQCAVCHGDMLQGTDIGPGLQGKNFKLTWSGRSLYELFDKIKATMPANAPGDLTPAQTTDLVAFILKLNEYPTGSADMGNEKAALEGIKLREK
ncbi:MAG: cytochrome c [Acidimicrobiia bacterium]|nr:cytochrome c [Acidimicrobiia bacterium]